MGMSFFGSRNPALRRAMVEVEFTSAKKVQKIDLAPDINGRNLHQNSTARLESASKPRRKQERKRDVSLLNSAADVS